MDKIISNKYIKITALVLAALFSIFVLSNIMSSTKFHEKTITSLDEKRTTVMELSAASAATSVALTLLPGDMATPIAEKITDLSGYFLIVLCAILLEKYLVTITGVVAFKFLIPIALIMVAVDVYRGKPILKGVAKKIVLFAVAIFLVIPMSVQFSNLIDQTYESSIQQTITSAKESAEAIEKNSANDEDENQGWVSGLISKVENGVNGAVEKVKNVLNNMIEAIAVLIVTTCLIPILVILFFIWLIKLILNGNVISTGNFVRRKN